MDEDEVVDGVPSAGSPEIRNLLSAPQGIADPVGEGERPGDISFDEAVLYGEWCTPRDLNPEPTD